MHLSRHIALVLVTLTVTASAVHAQQVVDPMMPRAGSWGAEAVFGTGIGANVLRFSSPTAAWLGGLSFNVTHQNDEFSTLPGGTDQSGWLGFADARLGRRWWKGDSGERIRPLTGLGVLGGVSSNTGLRSWNAGGYGELGASYFYSPHVSLGAAGELAAVYVRDRLSALGAERINSRWIVRGTLVRVNAAVYF